MFFKRKKKILDNYNSASLISSSALPLVPFGDKITASDVVLIAIDRVASQCAKLKARYIKRTSDGVETEKNGTLSYILRNKPNSYMSPFEFIYKVVALLLLNDNAFIYPLFNKDTLELEGLYPLNPSIVEPIIDESNSYYLKFYFKDGKSVILPKDNVIHLRRFYLDNDIFGGSGSRSTHEALLKTLKSNDALLQGVEKAIFSSFQIKGILKLNGILKETDKKKAIDSFNEILKSSNNSSVIPLDLKSEYQPLSLDPKLVDKDTLDFLQTKILDYFGVSITITNGEETINGYEFQDFSCDNFIFLDRGTFTITFLPNSTKEPKCTIIMREGYLSN